MRVEAPAASFETIALCHPMDYVEALRDATPQEGIVHLDADTAMSPGSFEAALRGAGGAVHAVDTVVAGKAANAFVATSAVSPLSISTSTTATARRRSSGPIRP